MCCVGVLSVRVCAACTCVYMACAKLYVPPIETYCGNRVCCFFLTRLLLLFHHHHDHPVVVLLLLPLLLLAVVHRTWAR